MVGWKRDEEEGAVADWMSAFLSVVIRRESLIVSQSGLSPSLFLPSTSIRAPKFKKTLKCYRVFSEDIEVLLVGRRPQEEP